ncbi:MAG: class I tRNA ligase family protein, partial [Parvularculaceae bacterium]|nr:class I tRNA ligase family protein [Parvularculaceae bacterium]
AMAAQGRNIRLSEARVEGYRNFGTKLWNAARFCEMNECRPSPDFDPHAVKETLNRWIIHEAGLVIDEATIALEEYRFNDAAGAAYRFAWNVFCDWHLELAKPILLGEDGPAKAETRAATAFVFDQILKLLHPFMPFATEALWQSIASRPAALIVTRWPTGEDFPFHPEAAAEINWLIGLVSEIRSVRTEMRVEAGAKLPLVFAPDEKIAARFARYGALIQRLARLAETAAGAPPKGALQFVHEGDVYALPLAGLIDLNAERKRLAKEIEKCVKDVAAVDAKFANAQFVERAPPEILEENKQRRIEWEARRIKLTAALKSLEES